MSYAPDETQVMLTQEPGGTPGTSTSYPSARLFKIAWSLALLGFILRILFFALDIYWSWRHVEFLRGNHDTDYLTDVNWLSGIMNTAAFTSTVLMIASIVFVIRGLLNDKNRARSGVILIGTLKKLEWVAVFALTLYLLFLPASFLLSFFSAYSYAYGGVLIANAALIFVSALPLIVAHALYKRRA